MEVIIRGDPKELAALVVAIQERQQIISVGRSASKITKEERSALANTIREILLGNALEQIQAQPPETTERIRNQGEEPRPQGTISTEDMEFIRLMAAMPTEAKILARGVILGINLSEKIQNGHVKKAAQ